MLTGVTHDRGLIHRAEHGRIITRGRLSPGHRQFDLKVLGSFSDSSGAGVVGENTATTGNPVGVEGTVPSNSPGYGLYTDVDTKVGGELVASPIAFPPYDTVGDDPQRVRDALGALFDEPAWAGPRYISGDSHPEGNGAFDGAVLAPTGDVVFTPLASDSVGVYDPVTDTYTSGDQHSEGSTPFQGGALSPTGEVVFAPGDSANVGVFDTNARTHKPRVTALHPLVNNS